MKSATRTIVGAWIVALGLLGGLALADRVGTKPPALSAGTMSPMPRATAAAGAPEHDAP